MTNDISDLFTNMSTRGKGFFGFLDSNSGLTKKEILGLNIDDGMCNFRKKVMKNQKEITMNYSELYELLFEYNFCQTYVEADNLMIKLKDAYAKRPGFVNSWDKLYFKIFDEENNKYKISAK